MNRTLWKKSLLGIAAGVISISIALPAASAEKYTIKPGDTFWKLSQSYKISLDSILAANRNANPLNLQPGQIVELPLKSLKESVSVKSIAPLAAANDEKNIVVTVTGEKHTYSKVITAKASAYSADPKENGGYAGLDYFGNRLKVGTVAVDPKVIPLGKTLYITGYQFNGLPAGGMIAKATDIGGAIKGNRIDIFVPGTSQHAWKFGYQNVKVYVLD